MNGRDSRPRTTGYQGTHKKTNDHVFEAKRAEYEKKLQGIDKDINATKSRLSAIGEEIRVLTGNDVNAPIREELSARFSVLHECAG